MLVAGVDVGNSTTEVALARVEPGGRAEWLLVDRIPTTGPKGSAASAAGVATLLDRLGRRVGERPGLALLAELHPVETGLVELGRLEELELAGRRSRGRPARLPRGWASALAASSGSRIFSASPTAAPSLP